MNVLRSLTIASLCILLTGLPTAHATSDLDPKDPSWDLQKNEDGIKVYFKSVEGSDVKAFMGKTIMNASVSSIVKAMKDEETCVDWVRGCVTAKTLDGETFNEAYQYGINDLPWPADDRDYVNKVKTTDNADTGEIKISLNAVEGHISPSENVRLTKMQIEYVLTPISKDRTAVTWTQHTEPGGNIPGWLVNILLVDIPFYSLSRLEEVANRPSYRSAKFFYGSDKHIIDVD